MDHSPVGFDEDDALDWCLWVLDNGLPNLPSELRRGESVPMARWVGPQLAAVLRAEWSWSETLGGEPDSMVSLVKVFRHTADGWDESNADGGGGWYDPAFQLPEIGPHEVQKWGTHTSGGAGWWCSAHWGRVGREIAYAELITPEGGNMRPIDSPIGAMVVAFDPTVASTIRYLTEDGDEAHVFEMPARDFT